MLKRTEIGFTPSIMILDILQRFVVDDNTLEDRDCLPAWITEIGDPDTV